MAHREKVLGIIMAILTVLILISSVFTIIGIASIGSLALAIPTILGSIGVLALYGLTAKSLLKCDKVMHPEAIGKQE